MQTTAILSALVQEQRGLLGQLEDARLVQRAGRKFHTGRLRGKPVVLALSRVGKVAAATTTAALIEGFDVQRVVFTGVAGGIGDGVNVGDVVVGTGYVQHDMNASPLFARFEVPLTGRAVFAADAELAAMTLLACQRSMEGMAPTARLHQGLIASGDCFVGHADHASAIVLALQQAGHAALAVEMEGAAVAQVCADYGVPFAAMRTISDRADAQAHGDFSRFIDEVASAYARAFVWELMALL